MVLFSKGWQFWPNERFFVFFHEMRHFLLLFSEKFMQMPKHRSFFEKLRVFVNSIIFLVFSRNEARFATFCSKVRQNAETWWFVRKVPRSCQIDEFSCFFTKWGTCCNFLMKNSCKRRNMVVCSKCWEFWPNRWFFVFFHFATFFWKLSQNAKTWSFVGKVARFSQIDDFSCFVTKWGWTKGSRNEP